MYTVNNNCLYTSVQVHVCSIHTPAANNKAWQRNCPPHYHISKPLQNESNVINKMISCLKSFSYGPRCQVSVLPRGYMALQAKPFVHKGVQKPMDYRRAAIVLLYHGIRLQEINPRIWSTIIVQWATTLSEISFNFSILCEPHNNIR